MWVNVYTEPQAEARPDFPCDERRFVTWSELPRHLNTIHDLFEIRDAISGFSSLESWPDNEKILQIFLLVTALKKLLINNNTMISKAQLERHLDANAKLVGESSVSIPRAVNDFFGTTLSILSLFLIRRPEACARCSLFFFFENEIKKLHRKHSRPPHDPVAVSKIPHQ